MGKFRRNLSALSTPALPPDTLNMTCQFQHDLLMDTYVTITFLVMEMSQREACRCAIGSSALSNPLVSCRNFTLGILLNAGPVIDGVASQETNFHISLANRATQ